MIWTTRCVCVTIFGLFSLLVSPAWSQISTPQLDAIVAGRNLKAEPDVPAAALETVEGRQLASQLKNLRLSEATMGANHPSLAGVRKEIQAVKQRLATFKPNDGLAVDSNRGPTATTVDKMRDGELRQLVSQLLERIEQLERRIFVLERSPAASQ